MLKFFRKIRQQLLQEGSFQKYLLYAFGEILLVMIGILLALQVNNWNETKKARVTELQALKNLQKEFVKNQDKFEKHITPKKSTGAAMEGFSIEIRG